MKKHLFFLCLALIGVTQLFAYDCYVDGIYYNLNTTNLTAEVTNETDDYRAKSYLGSIIIPVSITYNFQTYSVISIGDRAFDGCNGLTAVTLPNSVTTIGDGAFFNCSGLASVTIPNSVTTIGRYAFSDCYSLTSVTIGNSVEKMGNGAFSCCNGLKKVNITDIAAWCRIYFDYDATKPYEVSTNPLRYAHHLYLNDIEIKDLVIPASVTSIGARTFTSCDGLTSITIPNSVTTIGDYAFSICTGLTSVTIPNSITTIGEWAFCGCSGLTSITCYAQNPPICESDCFYGVPQNIPLYIPYNASINAYQSAEGWKDFTNIIPKYLDVCGEDLHWKHEGGTLSIFGTGEMYNFTQIDSPWSELKDSVTNIIFPSNITSIGNYAFYGFSKLTSITIPHSIITIGEGTFGMCMGLISVTIPNPVTTIGNSAFLFVNNIVYNGTATWESYDKYWGAKCVNGYVDGYLVYNDGSKTILCGCSSAATRDIIISNSVTTIGDGAFYGCDGLTSITCYAQYPPICGSYCFYEVPKDIPLYIPYASMNAYQSAEGWKDFINIIPKYLDVCGEDLRWKYKEGTLSISGTGEMYDFTQTDSPWLELKDSVTNIIFPSNITSIGNYAFYGFSKLTSITIPNSVTTIGDYAFSHSKGLTLVTIPNSVTTIGESAFEDCAYLKTITLGKALTDIGCNAFKGDFRIEEITSYAEVTPNVCSSTFDGLSKQYIYLYVPENSIRGYQVDPNWNGFDIRVKSADVTPMDDENPVVTPTDQDVTITWPITDGTDTYTLTITKNGEVVCVLTFNANGQLTNIAFAAPGHNGAHQAPAATLTAQGYQFTVTGLNPSTAYDYSVTATDAGGQTLAEHKGNFSTTGGGTPTSVDEVHGSQCTTRKFFHNGNLIIERNGIKYTATGQKVR